MKTAQIQITITLPGKLVDLLQVRANRLGVSVAQLVKKVLTYEVKEETYPTFKASKTTLRKLKRAKRDYEAGKAVDADTFFQRFANES